MSRKVGSGNCIVFLENCVLAQLKPSHRLWVKFYFLKHQIAPEKACTLYFGPGYILLFIWPLSHLFYTSLCWWFHKYILSYSIAFGEFCHILSIGIPKYAVYKFDVNWRRTCFTYVTDQSGRRRCGRRSSKYYSSTLRSRSSRLCVSMLRTRCSDCAQRPPRSQSTKT